MLQWDKTIYLPQLKIISAEQYVLNKTQQHLSAASFSKCCKSTGKIFQERHKLLKSSVYCAFSALKTEQTNPPREENADNERPANASRGRKGSAPRLFGTPVSSRVSPAAL